MIGHVISCSFIIFIDDEYHTTLIITFLMLLHFYALPCNFCISNIFYNKNVKNKLYYLYLPGYTHILI